MPWLNFVCQVRETIDIKYLKQQWLLFIVTSFFQQESLEIKFDATNMLRVIG